MDLVSIVITLLAFALVGFLVYLIITNIPMPEPYKQAIVVASVILLILYLLILVSGHTTPVSLRR